MQTSRIEALEWISQFQVDALLCLAGVPTHLCMNFEKSIWWFGEGYLWAVSHPKK